MNLRTTLLICCLAGVAAACNQSAQQDTTAVAGAASPTPPAAADTAALAKKPGWWKETVVYQLHPRSFQDSNGDGVSDLKGIIQRLEFEKLRGRDDVAQRPAPARHQAGDGLGGKPQLGRVHLV